MHELPTVSGDAPPLTSIELKEQVTDLIRALKHHAITQILISLDDTSIELVINRSRMADPVDKPKPHQVFMSVMQLILGSNLMERTTKGYSYSNISPEQVKTLTGFIACFDDSSD